VRARSGGRAGEQLGRGAAHAGKKKRRLLGLGGNLGQGKERARERERERVLGWARLLFFLSFPFSFPSYFLYSSNSNKSN
jgi:hypothetical protein